jgi:DNA-binding transcriptional MerR regulator
VDRLLTIGALAERCRLSRSALRFYDQCGLLQPVVVDEATGYRYYEASQVKVADLVRQLRNAEVPVEDVRAFLAAGTDERLMLLDCYRASLEARLVSARTVLDELERSMTANRIAGSGRCTVSAEALSHALGQVLFAVSNDPERPELAGVLVEYKDGSLRLVASDRYRMAVRDIVPEAVTREGRLRALLGTPDVAALRDRLTLGGQCELSEGGSGSLEVRLAGAEALVLPGLQAEFPDYESILVGLPAGQHCLVGRAALKDAFSRGHGSLAILRLVPREVQVDLRGDIVTLPTLWAGPAFEVLLNADFVSEALAAHVGPEVAIEVVEPLRPVTFRSADSGTFSVLVMPVRPRDVPAERSA